MTPTPISSLSERAYALLRIVAGALYSFHGMQKVLGLLTDQQPEVGSQLWIGGLLELVCGVAIALGVFTRLAAFLSSGTMAVAYAQFHWKFQFDASFWPGINGGELAAIYSFVFLYMATRSPGPWSLGGRAKS